MGQAKHQIDDKRAARGARPAAGNSGDGWRGFVTCDLSTDDKAAVKATLTQQSEHWEWVEERLALGYRLSVAYDLDHTSFILSLTAREKSDPNQGWTLTARGGSFGAALAALRYKDTVLLGGDWRRGTRTFGADLGVDDVE